MPPRTGPETDPGVAAVISFSRNTLRQPLKEISGNTSTPVSTISQIARKADKNAQLNGGLPYEAKNVATAHRDGRPEILEERNVRRLIRHATKSKVQRFKSWPLIAHEIGFKGSPPTIAKAFRKAGYGKYQANKKPLLTKAMKKKRLHWCSARPEWNKRQLFDGTSELLNRIFTDECSVKLGGSQGKRMCTRNNEEKWHPHCIDIAFKKYSEMMFWGSIAWNWKGPCHVYTKETPEELRASIIELAELDIIRRAEEEIV